jgi:hypothetical protein
VRRSATATAAYVSHLTRERPLLKFLNFIAFQAGWFACVLGAASGHAWLGSAAVGAVLLLHLALTHDPRGELYLALICAALGTLLELLLVNAGIAHYASPAPVAWLPPGWIVAMWVLFATALNVSLSWLHGRQILAAALGAVAAPMSYYAGARMGGMVLAMPLWISFLVIAALWAVAMPVLVSVAERIAVRAR